MDPGGEEQLVFVAQYEQDLHVTLNVEWRRVGFRIGKYLLYLKTIQP